MKSLLTTPESKKSHEMIPGVSTTARPKTVHGLVQLNPQEPVELLPDVLDHSKTQNVLFSFEETGVHAMLPESDPNVQSEDEVERFSENFYLEDKDPPKILTNVLNLAG